MIEVAFKMEKGLFFDRELVEKALGKTERKVLSKQGSYVRQRARSSIRRRKKSASPGSPPSAHTDLIKKILFQYEPNRWPSVIVGFAKLNAKPRGQTGTSKTVPELLESGGVAISWRDKKPRTWAAFPTMGPALAAEAPRFPEMWKDALDK